ncbi:MAG: DUF4157 domain-containing protein [Lysobacter sp.]|nr:DUF4157 domain-containing protein [Lysobacter sp.]
MTRNRLPGSRARPLKSASAPSWSSTAKPLPSADLAYFESRFGQDFSNVRIHAGTGGASFAGTMGAKAVTSGEDIAFAAGRYSPGTAAGRELLAHELAHVAQQREGGSAAPGAVESGAQDAARTVAQGGSVSAQSLGGASEGGLYCDDDEKAQVPPPATTPTTVPPPLLPYRRNFSLMPQLQPPLFPMLPSYDPNAKIDWLSMRAPFESRGRPFTSADGDSIAAEWMRSKALLETLGIGESFKLGFITQDWLLNKGLSYQLDFMNARDNPNAMDRMNAEWKAAYPDAFTTPMVPIFSTDWFRKSPKK